ncbi:MAG: substrate-binding domain-containing protein [Acidobacteriota bacterium]|nr:substrate-binding domain-containing protein [Acidobacteriota bacterium]
MKFKTARTLASVALVGSFAVAALPVVSSASSVHGVSDNTFNTKFSTMASLKSITAKGKGSIAVILPDTVSSTRYTEFDAPYLKKAFLTAGLKSSQFIIQNAQGSTTTQYTDAQADISKGAKVILLDALDSTTGSQIEKYAKAHGVKVIDYDRLVLGGSDGYYVSFNNVAVGTLIGQGLVSCLTSWKVKSPMVYEMKGDPTDNNATLFAQGYSAVLTKAGFTTAKGNLTVQGTGTWTPATALTDFQGVYSSNAKINAVVTPNDENAAPIISYLQSKGLAPKTIPFTGQDATLTGFQNIISGYQCGTVYKPVWLEAQAAAALAVYLRAGMAAPKSLVNGVTKDSTTMKNVPSVLLKATWVTAATVEKTVIADKVIKASDLCTATAPNVAGSTQPTYAQDCKTYGIK